MAVSVTGRKGVHLTDVAAFKRLEARIAALETALGLPVGLGDWTPGQVAAFHAELDGLEVDARPADAPPPDDDAPKEM